VDGEAVLYINPFKEDEMAETLLRVLSDETLRERHRRRSYVRTAQFYWAETASKTLAVYQQHTDGHS
jgi:glycosyltransferase involved in cell wall biosynthesis